MNTVLRTLCGVFALVAFSAAAKQADSIAATPEAAVEAYFSANRNATPELLGKAFHPSAMLYWLSPDGRVSGLSQYGWKTRMRTATARAKFEQRISTVDRTGDAAVVVVSGTRDGAPITDYLLLLSTDRGWRCIGKAYATEAIAAQPDAQAVAAISTIVETKLQSDARWDGALFLATQHPRGMVYNLDTGELVAASSAEWGARFDQRRRERAAMHPVGHSIDAIHATGNIGYAHWTIQWSDGSTWVDYALLVREDGRWSMINLAFVEAP
jgi:hypothetical protein